MAILTALFGQALTDSTTSKPTTGDPDDPNASLPAVHLLARRGRVFLNPCYGLRSLGRAIGDAWGVRQTP